MVRPLAPTLPHDREEKVRQCAYGESLEGRSFRLCFLLLGLFVSVDGLWLVVCAIACEVADRHRITQSILNGRVFSRTLRFTRRCTQRPMMRKRIHG